MKKIIVCVLVFVVAGSCQSIPNAASAKQLLQQTIAAMSSAQEMRGITDFTLLGVMRIAGSDEANPVKILSRGADDMRMEITLQEGGTHTVAFLHGRGVIKDAQGKETRVDSASRASTEIAFLPIPARLSDLLGSASDIIDFGSELINGRPARHIVISRQHPKERDPLGVMASPSKTELFIDAQSFLILKVHNVAYDARGHKASQRELLFSDYRPVNGLLLPFSITEISDGQKNWAISVGAIELNPKLSDADFKL